ncbi:MAG: diguanylate cyclase domain-containing protein [Acidimicrobiales bacterium]
MLDSLDEGIVVCDAQRVVRIANRESLLLQGLPAEMELVGHPFPEVTAMCASDGSPLALASHPLTRALQGTVVRGEQLLLGGGEGTRHDIVASARPFEVNGGIGALLILRDVTTQLQEQAWLAHLALHDPLTGLANRNLLIDQLHRMLGQLQSRGGGVALVFLDLDDFKEVNDRFGHHVGDEVLVAVGRRIQAVVRSSDVVARLGGDEFVVAHNSTDDRADAEMIVSRIRKALVAPYLVRGQTLAISASVGSVVADPRHDDPINLLVKADREMYRQKRTRHREGETGS